MGTSTARVLAIGALLLILYLAVAAAASAARPGQIVVDPSSPAWLAYHQRGPFFLAGPGDPEGFLYRGTRNADGTRDGDQIELIDKLAPTGANSIYLQAVRSHGGDGDASQNPFVESDPSLGLSEPILDQWSDWFRRMDQARIVIFFIVYDDGAMIWNTGDEVGAEDPDEGTVVDTPSRAPGQHGGRRQRSQPRTVGPQWRMPQREGPRGLSVVGQGGPTRSAVGSKPDRPGRRSRIA